MGSTGGGAHVAPAFRQRACLALEAPLSVALTVEDTSSCVQVEALRRDLDLRVDPSLTGVAVTVRVALDMATLAVASGGELLWERSLPMPPEDCPFSAALIAASVERGLSEIPAASWDATETAAPLPWFDIAAGVSLGLSPSEPRLTGWGRVGIPVSEPISATFAVRADAFGTTDLADATVRTHVASAPLGLGVDLRPLRLQAEVAPGIAVARGRGFDEDRSGVAPHLSVIAAVEGPRRGPLWARAEVEVPVLLVIWEDEGIGPSAREAPVRVGLSVGVGNGPKSR